MAGFCCKSVIKLYICCKAIYMQKIVFLFSFFLFFFFSFFFFLFFFFLFFSFFLFFFFSFFFFFFCFLQQGWLIRPNDVTRNHFPASRLKRFDYGPILSLKEANDNFAVRLKKVDNKFDAKVVVVFRVLRQSLLKDWSLLK